MPDFENLDIAPDFNWQRDNNAPAGQNLVTLSLPLVGIKRGRTQR